MEHYQINSIDKEMKYVIYKYIKKNNFDFYLSTYDGERDRLYYSNISNGGLTWYYHSRKSNNDIRLVDGVNIGSKLKEDVVCFNIINTKDKLVECC